MIRDEGIVFAIADRALVDVSDLEYPWLGVIPTRLRPRDMHGARITSVEKRAAGTRPRELKEQGNGTQ